MKIFLTQKLLKQDKSLAILSTTIINMIQESGIHSFLIIRLVNYQIFYLKIYIFKNLRFRIHISKYALLIKILNYQRQKIKNYHFSYQLKCKIIKKDAIFSSTKKSSTYAFRTVSKRVIQKIAEAKSCKKLTTVKNEHFKEIVRERYIFSEERQKIIDDLRLI